MIKNGRYACPSCGCTDKWAMISIVDNKTGYPEYSYLICLSFREDELLLVNHEEDINYFPIDHLRYNDEFDICLACDTIFS